VGPIEKALEWIIVRSRWLMAPFYIGLIAGLAVLFIKFFLELLHYLPLAFTGTESDVILGVLSLIDISLTGNLVLIVNFVSRIEGEDRDRPNWMEKVDFGGLKQKLMVSIVAISAVQVLKAFMNIERYDPNKLGWLIGIHALFLLSLLVVALSDLIGAHSKTPEKKARHGKS
jgi:uncharacterized protein (TIGR00645 family)